MRISVTLVELGDAQWDLIAPLLPPKKHRCRPRADDRRTIEGILWVLRSGDRWCDLPPEYGSDSTCHRRLKEEQGFRRFMRRGLDAAQSEWSLVGITHNLLKLWRSGQAPWGWNKARWN
ncbi:MAG: transposase [Chloroflexota bacterium]